MQTQSFHTHTWRCGHAFGTEREYVENAIKAGMTHLGFSDHSPYVFENGYYSNYRIRHEDLDSYFTTLLELKKEYAGQIELHIGFEAEYYPKFFEGFMKLIEPYPYEYLLLGQHFLGNEIGEVGSMRETDDPARLKRYVDQCSEGLATGEFAYFAHPDALNFTGELSVYEAETRRLCENALKANVPLEINLLGIRTGRHYPRRDLFRIAAEVGNEVVCGSDAHSPEDVQDQASYDKAMQMVSELGLKLIQPLTILKR